MEFSLQGQGRRSSTLPLWLGEAPGLPPRPRLSRLAHTSKPRPRHIHPSRAGPCRAPSRRSKAPFLRSPAPRNQAPPLAARPFPPAPPPKPAPALLLGPAPQGSRVLLSPAPATSARPGQVPTELLLAARRHRSFEAPPLPVGLAPSPVP